MSLMSDMQKSVFSAAEAMAIAVLRNKYDDINGYQ